LGKPGKNLFVAGFSYATTERELEKKFAKYGRVTRVRVVRDKRYLLSHAVIFIYLYLYGNLMSTHCFSSMPGLLPMFALPKFWQAKKFGSHLGWLLHFPMHMIPHNWHAKFFIPLVCPS
jgi:hypothetical protein